MKEKNNKYELTNPQKNIWNVEQYYKNTCINNICGSLIIKQDIDLKLLSTAINQFIKNNDSFKLRFKLSKGNLIQYFTKDKQYKFEVLPIKTEDQIEGFVKKMVNTKIDLINSNVFDIKLFKLSSGFGGFIANVHHIISDAATFSFISTEVVKIYSNLLKNEELTTKDYSYIDFIESEQEYLKSSRFEKDKDYWKNILTPLPNVLTLPSLSRIDLTNSNKAKREELKFDSNLINKIKDFCKSNKISIFNFFTAIYSIYIGRLNNMENFLVGTPILNRTNYAQRHTSGMFINTSVLNIDISKNIYFTDFVKNIAQTSMQMLKHQKYPYQYMLDNARENDKSISTLYDILLSYQITQATDKSLDIPYSTKWYGTDFIQNSLDIHFHDNNDTGNLLVEYDYKEEKYSNNEIKNMHNRIINIILQIICNPNILINDIDIITQEEKEELIYKVNQTDLIYDENIPIIKHFENQVDLTPNKTALVFEGKELSYKSLNEKANSLAYELRKNGVTNNTIIGIMLERSFEMIVAILACLKSGGAYIPIDPTYPEDRINYMLSDSNASILLTNTNYSINTSAKILYTNLENNFYCSNKENLTNISKPEDLSYLIYTSGSTGIPKGVMLKQKNLSNFYYAMESYIKYLKDAKDHKIVSITTISFDIFIFETLMSLSKGLQLYMTNENEQKITEKLESLIKQNSIEILQTTPSVMKFHLDNLSNKDNLKSLNYIILAGEPLPISLVKTLKEKIPNVTIYNGYGPSETTIFSTIKDVTNLSTISIGKPIANTQIYLLDKNKKLLPKGYIGEIYISGDGVGKGYINKEDLTCKKFIKNPFVPNKIMYSVGDLGFYNENNDIICCGRIDNQIKIHGLRIELEEIENQISSIYGITNTVVVKKQVNEKDALCAYYISNTPIDNENIKAFLKTKLPQYMLPQYFVKLSEFPHTPNGKIDKNKLPLPQLENAKKKVARNSTDKKLLKIIQNILNIKNVDLKDTLMDLGGDSLTAITLLTKISSKFKVQLTIKDVFGDKTIENISDIINLKKSHCPVNITKAPKQDVYPLSCAQKRIYYNSKMIGENNLVYNMPGGIIVEDILDENKIKYVFSKIFERHESFRTSFILKDDDIYQKIDDNINFNLPVFYNTENEIPSILKKFSKPFKLDKMPLFRAELHYIDNSKTMLLVDFHHIIMDGISLNNFIIEFERLYNGENLKKLPITYKDYSVWENEYNQPSNLEEFKNYWVNKLSSSEFAQLNLPYDYKLVANRSYVGNKFEYNIQDLEFSKIENFAKKIGVSPYTLFLSAFFILLYKYTGQEEIILGSPFANRNLNDTKRIIGMFVNNIAIKANIDINESFQKFVKEIKKQVINDLSHQPYPFDKLVKDLNINWDNSRNPLFDIMFTYQNREKNLLKLNKKEVKTIEINNPISKFNLSLEIKPEIHSINVEYCTDLFKETTIKNIIEHYMYVITQIMQNPNIKINDINMITPEEDKKLEEFNNTYGTINNDTTAYLIEQQVLKNPNEIAVICEDKKITYKQLDEKANSLANHLIKIGVKNNDIICIMANRSIETIVSMYAILKAGGAFLNIDPTYPESRTDYYIKNSKSQYVLTQRELKHKVTNFLHCVEIDLENNPIYEHNLEKPNVNIQMDDLSYIIYTSGSTGVPKGVMLNQVGLANMSKAMTKALDYLHDGKVHTLLSVTSTPFDIFVYEIIVSLTHGQRIVMANNSEHRNPKLLENLIKKYNTDVMTVTPSLMKIIYDNRSENTPLGLVKNMVFGGEPLPEKFVKDLKALADDITVFNIYGPSEITILSNVQNLNGEKEITTGPPIMNTQIHILDKNQNRVPIGVIGEIYISGIQVGKGYLGNPKLTSEKFILNKFGEGKMYRSGDIGRWTLDGKVQCLGRINNQIKIRGLRVELGEIENKMEQYPGVSAAVVNKILIDNNEALCGYYVTDGSTLVTDTEIKAYLKKYLPQYMVPSYIVQLEKMPYTINRKIDRKALPIPNVKEKIFKEKDPSLFSSDEQKLLQIWKNVLHLNKISLEDNFFDIGGDSILAIKMQIEALKYNFDFEYEDIFKYPTIKELANIKQIKIVNNEISNYDYSKIDNVLKYNNLENLSTIKKFDVGNILLIGGTGFLGVHILYEFLKTQKGNIYCLVRRKENIDPLARLKQKILFYFGVDFFEKYQNRICVIEGDIVLKNLGITNINYEKLKDSISTVINAGALVKHFGSAKLFYDINVLGTKNVVDFCKKTNKRLIHISTISVSGNAEKGAIIEETPENINEKTEFLESTLFVNQTISGIYTKTKYEAEKLVLEEIANGLDADILRMGNITNRYSDGVFQQNVEENAFAKRLKSFIEIGHFPDYLLNHSLELSPVDLCARATIKILENTSICNMFHIYNYKLLPIALLTQTLNELELNLSAVDDITMSKILTDILNDSSKKEILSGIIYDIDSNKKLIYTSNIKIGFDFTQKYLSKIGFNWKNIDKDYILKYINYFKKIGFINF